MFVNIIYKSFVAHHLTFTVKSIYLLLTCHFIKTPVHASMNIDPVKMKYRSLIKNVSAGDRQIVFGLFAQFRKPVGNKLLCSSFFEK